MIVADPFGSWVTGAREGLEDATKMRRAEDEAAASAYGLQTASQADPYRLQMLKNKAYETDVDRSLYAQEAQVRAQQQQEALKRIQQQIAESYGQYGLTQPILQDVLKNYPSATVGEGGLSFPLQGAQGSQNNVATPYGQINDPRRLQLQYLNDYRNSQLGIRQEGIGIQQQREDRMRGKTPGQAGAPSFLTGLGTTTMPSAPTLGSEVNANYPFPYMPKATNNTTPNIYGVQ